jgi:hypothetical protein
VTRYQDTKGRRVVGGIDGDKHDDFCKKTQEQV